MYILTWYVHVDVLQSAHTGMRMRAHTQPAPCVPGPPPFMPALAVHVAGIGFDSEESPPTVLALYRYRWARGRVHCPHMCGARSLHHYIAELSEMNVRIVRMAQTKKHIYYIYIYYS
jgi:hypothetical protein